MPVRCAVQRESDRYFSQKQYTHTSVHARPRVRAYRQTVCRKPADNNLSITTRTHTHTHDNDVCRRIVADVDVRRVLVVTVFPGDHGCGGRPLWRFRRLPFRRRHMRVLPARRTRQQVVLFVLSGLPGTVPGRLAGPGMPVVRQDAFAVGPSGVGLPRVRFTRGTSLYLFRKRLRTSVLLHPPVNDFEYC